jgi:hypothetical protein
MRCVCEPPRRLVTLNVEFTFEQFTELFRQVVKQLSVEERWQLLRELTREEDDKR